MTMFAACSSSWDKLSTLARRAQEEWQTALLNAANAALNAVEEMIYKEENILLPMSLETLSEDEWAEIWSASPKYGWCIVEPRQGYVPAVTVTIESINVPHTGALMLPTGHVSLEQLAGIFGTLPLDLTFVDADDRVAFFTEGPDRVFARSKAIIGRKVHNCHPPKSVETVDQILSDFKAGRQNVAEFWINFQNKFVHVRYFAVRASDGRYLGTVELTQDLTPLRALQGRETTTRVRELGRRQLRRPQLRYRLRHEPTLVNYKATELSPCNFPRVIWPQRILCLSRLPLNFSSRWARVRLLCASLSSVPCRQ